MLLRLAYLTVTNLFGALRLLPMSDRDKNAEILALRHQFTVLERQLGTDPGCDSHRRTGRCLPLCWCRRPVRSYASYGYWYDLTPCCDGTAT
ncbi:hypothetical protein ACFVTY_03560 [Streptomyces sp. NPDC058067]|uniref:hypothetical protein n=1 Tax=Streptomyces sp. NPDC058067 TaxID=3346324 RepID=UPI0036E00AFD